ncbi:MAG TPA: GTP-binding protein, partial [Sphingomicrobium sp.]
MDLLRFITCGSVDDGKSTLIGRLLHDCGALPDDQIGDGEVDFAALLDGLSAEREQGITIDVAYRFFESPKRKYIVADTPGHEQYTRNMVTGASTADLAIVLVDARKGVLTQTRRHSYLARLIGIRRIVLAVTKMDLVDYDRAAFDAICADYRAFAGDIGIEDWTAIPVSGLNGDNVCAGSGAMPWYSGPTLIDYLDSVPVDAEADSARPFR